MALRIYVTYMIGLGKIGFLNIEMSTISISFNDSF